MKFYKEKKLNDLWVHKALIVGEVGCRNISIVIRIVYNISLNKYKATIDCKFKFYNIEIQREGIMIMVWYILIKRNFKSYSMLISK